VKRAFALIVAAVGAALWSAAPAQAIETSTFGAEPSPKTTSKGARTSYRIALEPNGASDDALRVWNKTDQPLTLKLSAISASVDAAGKVALGGSAGTASWFSFEPEQVELGPKASSVVRFSVRAPRSLDGSDVAAAITVEPVASQGAGVAVVERLATMVYVSTTAGGASGGIGWKLYALIALSVISIAGAVLTWTRPRRGGSDDEYQEEEDVDLEREPVSEIDPAEVIHAANGQVQFEVDDAGVDRLVQAMYEPATERARPRTLELVASAPFIERRGEEIAMPPDHHEGNEEFAWGA
jgi:hypothetical protein